MNPPHPVSPATTRLTVFVALLAVVFGRALASALPGSRAGLGRVLDASRLLGGFSSQLLAVLLVLIIGRLIVGLWQDSRLPLAYRVVVTPASLLIIMLIIAASFDELMNPYLPEVSLLLGLASTLVAINSIKPSVTPIRLRASGITLVLVVAASASQITARLLALQASGAALHRQFAVARWLASGATVLDALALVLTAVWLTLFWKRGRFAIFVALGVAGAMSHFSRSGSRPGGGFATVLLSRSLAQLHREPGSFFPVWLRDAQELFALFIAGLLIAQPRGIALEQRLSIALLLLARSSPDIPLCSGLLVAGALGLVRLSLLLEAPPMERDALQDTRVDAALRAR